MQPDFFGFWHSDSGLEDSVFFMFLGEKDGKITGTIEDELGRAIFNGTKTGKEITFDKQYMADANPSAYPDALRYMGEKIKESDNFYEGIYTSLDKTQDVFGKFILLPFPRDSHTMNLLYEDIRLKNLS